MSIKKTLTASLVSFALLCGTVQAAIIDFEEIDNSSQAFSGSSLDSQGFNFSNTGGGSGAILHWAQSSTFNADPGGVTYSHNYSSSLTTFTEIGGGLFDLSSIDFGDVYNTGVSQTILVSGFFGGGGSSDLSFVTDTLAGLETFSMNWTGLTSVTWTETTGSFLQLDNVVVNESVPEPSVIALFGLGLLGLSFARRRKAQS